MCRSQMPALRLAGLLAVLLISGAVGCGSAEAPAVEGGGGFPDDIPVYEGLAEDYVSDSGPLLVVNGTTADSVEQVRAFYRERLPALGWTETTQPARTLGDPNAMAFDKGSAKMDILVSKDGEKTRVSVQVEGYQR